VPPPGHIPVLLHEVLALLAPHSGDTYLDCTAGLAGHAAAIATLVGPLGTVVLNDADPGNLRAAEANVRAAAGDATPRLVALHGNFADAARALAQKQLRADVVLADLGFASNQVEDEARGFSFSRDGPLDMRMDPRSPITAAELVNSMPEVELARIIYELGEDRGSRAIARKIVEARAAAPISTTGQLAEIVRSAAGGRHPSGKGRGTIDPATKTFQALRIVVNDELGSLEALLEQVRRGAEHAAQSGETRSWLAPGARIGIISFHSLEDRMVKRSFHDLVHRGLATALTRGPVEATEDEVASNPRSRSAKLRAVRIGEGGGGGGGDAGHAA
jgi:16S rRNA (cytosine1402-N4)-methyltransferase